MIQSDNIIRFGFVDFARFPTFTMSSLFHSANDSDFSGPWKSSAHHSGNGNGGAFGWHALSEAASVSQQNAAYEAAGVNNDLENNRSFQTLMSALASNS
jgi:hypothetical protein